MERQVLILELDQISSKHKLVLDKLDDGRPRIEITGDHVLLKQRWASLKGLVDQRFGEEDFLTLREPTEPILNLCPPASEYLIIVKTESGFLKVKRDGNIECDEEVEIDEAATTFWKALAAVFPGLKEG